LVGDLNVSAYPIDHCSPESFIVTRENPGNHGNAASVSSRDPSNPTSTINSIGKDGTDSVSDSALGVLEGAVDVPVESEVGSGLGLGLVDVNYFGERPHNKWIVVLLTRVQMRDSYRCIHPEVHCTSVCICVCILGYSSVYSVIYGPR